MLRFSFVAVLALVSLESTPAAADSFWTHNGSEMRLRADGSSRTFLYERPRSGIAAEGVERGTVLFQGLLTDAEAGGYTGTAFIFSARCGKRSYEVSGPLQNDGTNIALEGATPQIDRSTCQSKGTKEGTLIFEFVRSDEPSPTRLPTAKVPNCRPTGDLDEKNAFEEYKACLEKEANRICRGTSPLEELVRCFNDAVTLVYKKSGITGFATDFAVGSMNPFIFCKSGVCRRGGGGSLYSCERRDTIHVRECDGELCNDVVCPVRECRKMCARAQ